MAERITRRRRACVLVATAGIIVGGRGLLPQASATPDARSQRFSGADRYGTAVDVSKHSYTTATDAVIASGEGYADALAASYVAGQVAAPILLVTKSEVPSITATELSGLGVKNVWLVGGTNAISSGVESQLSAKYTVKRLAGADRYETAKAAATQTTGTVGTYKSDKTAIVASGENYPDALAGGALAYGKKLPLLLTAKDSLPPATSQALTSLGIKRVLLLGGSGAVADTVAAAIAATNGGITVERVGGANRADTAAKVGELALGGLGFKNTEVVVASGNGFADALAGATYAGKNLFPILLMGSVPPETAAFVKNHNSTIAIVTALGGTAVIPHADVDSLVGTAKCQPATTTTTGPPITLLPPSTTTTTASTSSTLPSCTTPTTAGATTTTAGGATTTAPTVLPTTTVAPSGGTTTTNPLCGVVPLCP
jgi:putative cell wall-binding protein